LVGLRSTVSKHAKKNRGRKKMEKKVEENKNTETTGLDARQQAGKLTKWLAGWLAGSGSETCTTAARTSTATLFLRFL